MFNIRLSSLRKEKKKTQQDLADYLGLSRPAYTAYERGNRQPDYDILQKIADYFDVSVDYLLGRTDRRQINRESELPELTEKEERDIAKDLEEMVNNLHSASGYAAFDGQSMEDMDDEDKELLIASLENSLRLAKRMAKQKFTPKKYRE